MRDIINKYMNKIQTEQSINYTPMFITLGFLIFQLLLLFLTHSGLKSDKKLSKKISAITGKQYKVIIINKSDPDAYCFGGIGGRSLYICDSLIKMCSEDEVLAICLHEVGHIKNLDTLKGILLNLGAIGFVMMAPFKIYLNKSINIKIRNVAGILCFIIIIAVYTGGHDTIIGKLNEYRADKEASKYGYGKPLASALTKLEEYYEKEFIKTKPWKITILLRKIEKILDVHPSTKNRVKKIFQNEKLYESIANSNKEKVKEIITNDLKEDT